MCFFVCGGSQRFVTSLFEGVWLFVTLRDEGEGESKFGQNRVTSFMDGPWTICERHSLSATQLAGHLRHYIKYSDAGAAGKVSELWGVTENTVKRLAFTDAGNQLFQWYVYVVITLKQRIHTNTLCYLTTEA
jgi:hypothetical protein